jgi:hypothetical protein
MTAHGHAEHYHRNSDSESESAPIPSQKQGIQLSTIENYKGVEFRLPQC